MINAHSCLAAAFAAAVFALAPQAGAQETGGAGLSFELGAAGKLAPRYFGASNVVLSPAPLFRLKRLELPNGFSIGGGAEEGFSLSPSIDVIGERSLRHSPELVGLTTIDTAVELGVAAKYQFGQFRVMGAVRRGFGGHKGFRGELGADVIFKANEQLSLHGGPRLNLADRTFANAYFGVTAAEASALFPLTRAGGGLISAGLEAGLRYQFDDYWAVEAGAGWSRLTGDAARSPITAQGSRDQYTLSFGVLRRFDIAF